MGVCARCSSWDHKTYAKSLSMCEVEPPTAIVGIPEVQEAHKKVWDELVEKLNKIERSSMEPLQFSVIGECLYFKGPASRLQEHGHGKILGNDDIRRACSTPLLG